MATRLDFFLKGSKGGHQLKHPCRALNLVGAAGLVQIWAGRVMVSSRLSYGCSKHVMQTGVPAVVGSCCSRHVVQAGARGCGQLLQRACRQVPAVAGSCLAGLQTGARGGGQLLGRLAGWCPRWRAAAAASLSCVLVPVVAGVG